VVITDEVNTPSTGTSNAPAAYTANSLARWNRLTTSCPICLPKLTASVDSANGSE